MSFRNRISNIFKGFAYTVLDVDDTSVPKEQLDALKDFISKYKFDMKTKDIKKLMGELKKKHLVDSIVVTKKDGTLLVSSEGNGMKEAITGSALFNYINSELSLSQTVLIKSKNDWFMLFQHNGNIYIVRSPSDISSIELRALAKELDSFLTEENFETLSY